MLGLLTGAIGEADDREAGNARLEMRLDLDAPRLEADESVSHRTCEHPRDARRRGLAGVATHQRRKRYELEGC